MKEMLMKEEVIIECLGYKGAWDALVRALTVDELKDNFDYIMRCYDINDNDF